MTDLDELVAYIPMDRRHALAAGRRVPDKLHGAALFADISGFTPLTETLVRELGPQRGAEELTRFLNLVYDAIIDEVHSHGGSVVAFAGDAITCWFDECDPTLGPSNAPLAAAAAALTMQAAMHKFATLTTPAGTLVRLAMKAAVATGHARRLAVGSPKIRLLDALAGETLDRLGRAEHLATMGEVLADEATVQALGTRVIAGDCRSDQNGEQFWRLQALAQPFEASSWPELPRSALKLGQLRPWLLPPVYERLRLGRGEFLAELRPTVALFVRFGGIDYDTDPDAGTKLDAFVRWAQVIVTHYRGTLIDINFGDKGSYLYANFGAPIAHEDNAERAAAAALALHRRPDHLPYIHELQIGISQGRMRAGAYGGAGHRTYGVLGDEVNMAARLMTAASPGQTLVTSGIQQRLAQRFTFQELPPLHVKGKRDAAIVYALTGEQTPAGTQHRAPAAGLPLFGREGELAVAADCIQQAGQGKGQVLNLSGKAGLGKTRLALEVLELAAEAGFRALRGECPSYGMNSSYLVWQPIWANLFGLDGDSLRPEDLARIGATLAGIDPSLSPRLPLLGPLLQREIADNELTRSLDAKLRKTALEALLADCLAAFAQEQPIIIFLDDCQWIDPLSRDLLHTLAQAAASLPVMIVYAQRPAEFGRLHESALYDLAYARQVVLEPLPATAAAAFINAKARQLAASADELPTALAERISVRAEGNPFLLEEMLVYLHNSGADLRNPAAAADIALPDSLQRLVLSLLDQFPEAQKITVKVASVLGRIFRSRWLWGAYPQIGAPGRVHKDLEALCRQELLVEDKGETEPTFGFRQMITQNVTYETLPLALKSTLHGQLATYIEQTYRDELERYLDLLAYHFDLSENEAKRRHYLLAAGSAAQEIYANEAAIDYYRRLLPLLADTERPPVLMRLGGVLELVGQWDEANACYAEALALAEQAGKPMAQAQAQIAVGEMQRKRGQFSAAAAYYDQALAAAQVAGDQGGMAKALICSGTLAAQQGDYAAAANLYERSLAIRRRLGDLPNVANVLNNLGILAQFQGDYELSRTFHEEALSIRRGLGGQWAIAISLNNLGTTALDQQDYATASSYLEEAIVLQRAIGDKWAIANALNNLANVRRELGEHAIAAELYGESVRLNAALGEQRALAYLLEDIGVLAGLRGKAEQALQLAGAAAAIRVQIQSPLSPAEQDALAVRLQVARAQVGAQQADALYTMGQALVPAAAVELALRATMTA